MIRFGWATLLELGSSKLNPAEVDANCTAHLPFRLCLVAAGGCQYLSKLHLVSRFPFKLEPVYGFAKSFISTIILKHNFVHHLLADLVD
jgi:hypothetical protein